MYWASLHLVHTLHRRVSQARATVFGKRRSSFSTRTKVRLTLVSEGLAGTAYAWIFFSDGMLDRTSEVTEGTDDTYTMRLQGRESATPNIDPLEADQFGEEDNATGRTKRESENACSQS